MQGPRPANQENLKFRTPSSFEVYQAGSHHKGDFHKPNRIFSKKPLLGNPEASKQSFKHSLDCLGKLLFCSEEKSEAFQVIHSNSSRAEC